MRQEERDQVVRDLTAIQYHLLAERPVQAYKLVTDFIDEWAKGKRP
jgi:hypothetical protein